MATASAGQQAVRFVPVSREKVMSRLEAIPGKTRGRGPALRTLLENAGCAGERLSELPVKRLRDPDIICTLAGETGARIVVGAHYDASDKGHGVADNWTGAALLASVFEAISAEPRRHTFVFAAFSGEEIGLLGSTAYVKALSKEERKRISLMLNMDSLGLGPVKVWLNGSDDRIARVFAGVARAMKSPVAAVNVERVGSTDSEPFREAVVPVISLHSITQQTLEILHSPRDRLEVISRDDYYETYRLVLGFLVYADRNLEPKSGPAVSGSGPRPAGER